jgi:peptide-methionine (S)-S-oxide reductase
MHDPTTLNRQGPDIGAQYRSAIFYTNEDQKNKATLSKENLEKSGKYNKKIATEIIPASEFYPAEDYHQQYYMKRGIKSCPVEET